MDAVRLYVGYDEREAVGSTAFLASLLERSSVPVSLAHITRKSVLGMGIPEGTNAFTLSRFLIPYFERWTGWAIFMDGADMLMRADIADLWALRDPYKTVQVVKHEYKTKNPRKYLGTAMESENTDYERKNWASLMLINCSHFSWRKIKPESIALSNKLDLLQFRWLNDHQIGELPKEWNWLADEYGPNPDAKVLHWTAGVPGFPCYKNAPHSEEWFSAVKAATHATD